MDGLSRDKKKRFRRLKRVLLILFLVVFVITLVFGIWSWRNFAGASNKLFGSSNPFDLIWPAQLDNTEGRVNILLVGYSVDDPGHAGADLTDSILVLSLDQSDHTGYMLSIPRDLYVFIPGRGQAKINEAYQEGEQQEFTELGYPSGGAGLLEKIVSDTFGLDMHYYALIDYATVREVVNALGDITVDIKSSDPRGLYDPNFRPEEGGPLDLTNGRHEIDGPTALKLTRARGATSGSYGFPRSDFTRTQHQQLVLAAIKEKLTWQRLLNPSKNGQLLDALADNVRTDVELSEAWPLFRLLGSVPDKDLKSIGLHDIDGVSLLRSYTTPSGQSALVPTAGINNYGQIQAAIDQLDR